MRGKESLLKKSSKTDEGSRPCANSTHSEASARSACDHFKTAGSRLSVGGGEEEGRGETTSLGSNGQFGCK
jgi:hypothetical protein